MPHHPKNKHRFYIHWQLIRNSSLWTVSSFEEHSFWFFFKGSHREQDMSLPAPGQLPASSNCVTRALGSGRNEHLPTPVSSPGLLCAHTEPVRQNILISDHLLFRNQQKAITVKNAEQAHKAAEMYVQALGLQIMSPGTNWAKAERREIQAAPLGWPLPKGERWELIQIYLFSPPGF